MWLLSKVDCCADRSVLPLLSAYKEYLVTIQLMTPQEHDHSECVYVHLGGQIVSFAAVIRVASPPLTAA